MIPVVLLPSARQDVRRAGQYYAGESRRLAAEFISQVSRTLELIASDPELGVPTRKGARRFVMRRFPYAVIYRLEPQRALVLAIAHQRRDPGYWLNRM